MDFHQTLSQNGNIDSIADSESSAVGGKIVLFFLYFMGPLGEKGQGPVKKEVIMRL